MEIVKKRLLKVAKPVMQILENEPAVLRITGSTTIVGDIHGNLDALDMILEEWRKSDTKNILFLGDYVDRGLDSAECLLSLLELKTIDPNHVFLLRGNHEDANMNIHYGFYRGMGSDNTFLMGMHRIFETMPIAAIIDSDVFCVHGGITGDTNINNITKENSYQYLWNDPSEVPGVTRSERGNIIRNFGHDVVEKFLITNKLSCIVRAHEFQVEGYQWWFDRKLLSLFSSFNYCGMHNNAAFVEYKDNKFEIYILNVEQGKYWDDN
jgi:diadenosine tetraphosphatase ApaH/serine/threonine PP2A family protein phosphatase